jgi:hypothetical protein
MAPVASAGLKQPGFGWYLKASIAYEPRAEASVVGLEYARLPTHHDAALRSLAVRGERAARRERRKPTPREKFSLR